MRRRGWRLALAAAGIVQGVWVAAYAILGLPMPTWLGMLVGIAFILHFVAEGIES